MQRALLAFSRRSSLFPAFGLALAAALAVPAQAATPASGTLTDTSAPLTYQAGPFAVANKTPVPLVDVGPQCNNPSQPCDDFSLTVTLPADYATLHPDDKIRFTISWKDAGTGQSDYDLYIYDGDVTTTNGNQAAAYQSATSANPEVANARVKNGTNKYTVKIVPYTTTGEVVDAKIELIKAVGGAAPTPNPDFGRADPTLPGVARYLNYFAPDGSPANTGTGEFNIGFNPKTGHVMTMSSAPVFRLTLPDRQSPPLPEACDATWENVSAITTNTPAALDPILWTDQVTGRTFSSNSTAGANGEYAYTDDDGTTWIPAGASPPNGGSDHQTIGSGPYPAALSSLATPVNQGRAVYYCSQAYNTQVAGPGVCQRSDTLGASFGPGMLVSDAQGVVGKCGGVHGHVRVAPDGSVYLPYGNCGTQQGVEVSTDAGTSWKETLIPNSTAVANDPSVAIDADNTAYFCYVNGTGDPAKGKDGHVHVAVSHDGGKTWADDHDIGAAKGIENAAFTEAVGGSSGRAACGFLGTNVTGNYESLDFPGIWYLYIASTYDGGKTWTTVNATPDDPVQGAGGIWRHGGGNVNRNLLDFNEVTIDDKGHVLFGYDDGCVGDCVKDPSKNSFVAHERVARQVGGKPLFAANDPTEPAKPNAACLAGARDEAKAHLKWKPSDNGGAEISAYKIYRGVAADGETLLTTIGNKATFEDASVDASVPKYFYKIVAVNPRGESLFSNEIALPVTPTPPPQNVCAPPGLTLLTDPTGDSLSGTPGTDLKSFQLSQPYAADGSIKLTFTLNTDPGQTPQPPGSAWYVSFKLPDGKSYRGVRLEWDATGSPHFLVYVPGTNSSGGTDGRFVASSVPADPSSSYDAARGVITIVAKLSDLGLKPGDVIQGFNSASTQTTGVAGTGPAATQTLDQMPNDLSYTGSYTVNANDACKSGSLAPSGNPSTPSGAGGGSTPRFGGALGAMLLLPLLGLAALRRKR